jgi:hypothetical protein
MTRLCALACMLLVAVCLWGQSRAPHKFQLPDVLNEVSGLYHAGPDSLWWHNDSGDSARLFLTDERGRLRETRRFPQLVNRDWEDLTADDQGRIYIGDFGNNLNARRDLAIYIYDPHSESVDSLTFRYPDQDAFPPPPERANFDMEAFFWYRDSLHLFSKNRLWAGNYFTKHYVLPAAPGDYVAELRDSLYLKRRVVTAAAISPDRQAVALLAYWFKPLLGFIPITSTTIFLFEDFPEGYFLRGALSRRKVPKGLPPTQYESIDFIDNRTVLVASERTIFFKQKARRLKIKRREATP